MRLRVLGAEEVPILAKPLADLAKYHNAVATSFAGIYPTMADEESIRDTMLRVRDGHARVEVLEDETGEIAGFCNVRHHERNGEIDWLYVREDMRESGWGKRLLESAEGYLREKGVRLIDLYVVAGSPAKGFYQAMGFETRVEVMSKV